MTRLTPILALLLTFVVATPALAGSATDSYADALDLMHGSRAVTKAPDDAIDIAAEMRAFMRYAELQINLAKADLRQLEAAYRTAMRELKGDAHECERERLTSIYAAERTRLKEHIRDYRHMRGDRRGFFTKAWHSIGPVGRRFARAIGRGALDIVTSGGSLGGAARGLLRSAGRDELKGAALRAVARNAQGRSAAAVAAASSACDDETDIVEEGAPAIPPGTYVGEFAVDLSADEFITDKHVEANLVELRVTETGGIAGDLASRVTGRLDGCPGYIVESTMAVAPGQRIGPGLPQEISVDYHALMVVPIGDLVSTKDSVHFVCSAEVEPFIDESGSAEVEVDATDEGVLILIVGDELIELRWVP